MDPRFPVGKFSLDGPVTADRRQTLIAELAECPAHLRRAVEGLSDTQLDTPYRPGGWTVRQVVHHMPDSHMNAYVRFKLALTEDTPTIKPYDEARWAELHDAAATPVAVSLDMLEALHDRWVRLLRAMSPEDFERTFRHPERERPITLGESLAIYSWHGRHHVAHVKIGAARQDSAI